MITSTLVRASLDACRKGEFDVNSHLLRFMREGRISLSARTNRPHELRANCILWGLGFISYESERSQISHFDITRKRSL